MAERLLRSMPFVSVIMGVCLFLFHFVTHRQYGLHGDELYFIVCGSRPAWGYVDHPPFVPMVARVATMLMGTNLVAIRFFPALALGLGCTLTGWLARRLGGGRYAEFLASLSFACAPMLLRTGAFLNIPCFEVLFWLLAAHLLVTLCQRDDARWWVAVGVVAGLALLNKHTTLFLGTGLAVGILLTERRKDLFTPWPFLGAVIAFIIFLPNLRWQYDNDWATLEFVRNLNASEMQGTSRALFVVSQILLMNPINALIWIAGIIFFMSKAGHPYRLLGWVFVTVMAILLVFKAKVYYSLPAYPMLLAGGAVLLERRFDSRFRRYARVMLPAAITAMGAVFVPVVCPVGTLDWKERYISRVLGFIVDSPTELTFDFRYQLGRNEQIQAFHTIYESLDEQERGECTVLSGEYGVASEVNVLGRSMGLPLAISGNNSYYLWGPQGASGACVIAFGFDEDFLRRLFGDVRVAGEAPCPWGNEAPALRPIYLCRKPVAPLEQMWSQLKSFR
ncbi:MAG: glycosyltransferase family 39 protein [Candidatus Hydrogenedentes bacterium]|nr:glycosyltransferase family 39 protein [Candidatus Hydrogenedentota bacterium]